MNAILTYLTEHPEKLADLYLAASEIVDDFNDYGPVLQANDDGAYDSTTAIENLRKARDEIVLGSAGYRPSSARGPLNR